MRIKSLMWFSSYCVKIKGAGRFSFNCIIVMSIIKIFLLALFKTQESVNRFYAKILLFQRSEFVENIIIFSIGIWDFQIVLAEASSVVRLVYLKDWQRAGDICRFRCIARTFLGYVSLGKVQCCNNLWCT